MAGAFAKVSLNRYHPAKTFFTSRSITFLFLISEPSAARSNIKDVRAKVR